MDYSGHPQNLFSYPTTDRPCNNDERTACEVRWHVWRVALFILAKVSRVLKNNVRVED